MPIVELPTTLNYPRICHHMGHLLSVFAGDRTAMLDMRLMEKEWDFEEFRVNDCTVFVSKKLVEAAGINQSWLEQKLGPGIACYVPAYGGGAWLPLTLPQHWIVQAEEEAAPGIIPEGKEQGLPFARVEYTDETCLAELCCNAWKYKFDETKGVFIRHTQPEWNAVKGRLRMEMLPMTGGTDERVADYGRLVLFLLSRANLSDAERSVFAPLLECAPSFEALSGVVAREALVQSFVAEAKKDPAAFLAWNGDWTNFWWNTAPQNTPEENI